MGTFNDQQDEFDKLTGNVETFLGFRPSAEDLEEFPFDLYRFIMIGLRDRDRDRTSGGSALLERFVQGQQEIWVTHDRKAKELPTLFQPDKINFDFIAGLRKLVAFGDDLIEIVNAASETELRRIIQNAIVFWRNRGIDFGFDVAVSLVTGNRFFVRNFFDFRFITGETFIGEELGNDDPNMISVQTLDRFRSGDDGLVQVGGGLRKFFSVSGFFEDPEDIGAFIVVQDDDTPANNGAFEITSIISPTAVEVDRDFTSFLGNLTWFIAFKYDEFITEIRVVDDITGDGAVNRTLLELLLEEARPSSERINIVYITFLDRFNTENDFGQWTGTGDFVNVVKNGVLTLTGATPSGGTIETDYFNDSTWKNFTYKTKVSQETFGIWHFQFLRTDDDNNYFFEVDFADAITKTIRLFKNIRIVK